MAVMPEPTHNTRNLIFKSWEDRAGNGFREHLGASIIGRPCTRSIWYSFRWSTVASFPGRVLRLFNRGQREEAVFVEELKRIGVEVVEIDPRTSEQWQWSAHGGHFGGSGDGIATEGVPEAPKSPHIIEMKTHNDKSFKSLVKDGVEQSKPEHYAQMQVYMGLSSIDRALYMAVNKNDDDLYIERVKFNKKEFVQIMERARTIIESVEPPARISDDPAWWQCNFCDHSATCHSKAAPVPTCRSCVHATAAPDGEATWLCEKYNLQLDKNQQMNGCASHAYLPQMLETWAEPIDAIDDDVVYTNKITGKVFKNGPTGYSSVEIYKADAKNMIGDEVVDTLKQEFNGTLIETHEVTE